jgi:hypothetical protein
MTADLNERAKLNSYRFIAVNIAQFIVGGFTLPLVAKFAEGQRPAARLADDDDDLGRALPRALPRHVFHHQASASSRSRKQSPRRNRISPTC